MVKISIPYVLMKIYILGLFGKGAENFVNGKIGNWQVKYARIG